MTSPNGKKLLRILLVEDSKTDADLIIRTLQRNRNGDRLEIRHVETLADVIMAIDTEPLDLVICDYVLPGFDAMIWSGAFPFSTHCSSAASASKLVGPSPPPQ